MKRLFSLACLSVIISCSQKKEKEIVDYIVLEKDIIPEGVAFDTATSTIYISSTYKKKIISIAGDGTIRDFIKEGQDDIKSVIGMEVDHRTNSFWAVSSEARQVLPLKDPGPHQWRSSVYLFNLSDGTLKKKYTLDKDSVFLNDITVGDDGTVYITESLQSGVLRILPGSDSITSWLHPHPFGFINGICFADKKGWLYVSSIEGIVGIEISTGKYIVLPSASDIDHKDIDGLSFTNGYFIGHQSTKVTRFWMNANRDSIIRSEILNSGKEFDASTTGEIGKGYYYFIVNSQIQSGVDYKNQVIKPMDSLDNYIIRKIKL